MAAWPEDGIFRNSKNTAMTLRQRVNNIRQWDNARPGFVGEHWLVLGAGLLAMRQARRSNNSVGRLVAGALGAALVARAASGRGGVASVVSQLAKQRTLLSRLLPPAGRG